MGCYGCCPHRGSKICKKRIEGHLHIKISQLGSAKHVHIIKMKNEVHQHLRCHCYEHWSSNLKYLPKFIWWWNGYRESTKTCPIQILNHHKSCNNLEKTVWKKWKRNAYKFWKLMNKEKSKNFEQMNRHA